MIKRRESAGGHRLAFDPERRPHLGGLVLVFKRLSTTEWLRLGRRLAQELDLESTPGANPLEGDGRLTLAKLQFLACLTGWENYWLDEEGGEPVPFCEAEAEALWESSLDVYVEGNNFLQELHRGVVERLGNSTAGSSSSAASSIGAERTAEPEPPSPGSAAGDAGGTA